MRNFWETIKKISNIVSILGFISIVFLLHNWSKETQQQKAENMINEAIGIFTSANDTIDYHKAYKLFFEAHSLKPNDDTGYKLFFEYAERLLEEVMLANDSIYKYDNEVAKYLHYADSLNIYRSNEAKKRISQFEKLKELENK